VKSRNYVVYTIIGLLIVSAVAYSLFQEITDKENEEIFISTTSSVENTGLLDVLVREFEKTHKISVKYTAVGSGAAIQLARDGEVDGVLVHAPDLEQELIADGYADERHQLWYNYFILVGPSSNPAGIQESDTMATVMEKLYEAGKAGTVNFYSRGDNSGTHQKELALWETAEIAIDSNVEQDWYVETGTGMSATLTTTDNDNIGYTLTDIGTFATLQAAGSSLGLQKIYEEDDLLYNPYSFLVINEAATGTDLNTEGILQFLAFLQAPSTLDFVENYTRGGIILFTPIATEN
jgi:tungstate transport system substrate-binding protein